MTIVTKIIDYAGAKMPSRELIDMAREADDTWFEANPNRFVRLRPPTDGDPDFGNPDVLVAVLKPVYGLQVRTFLNNKNKQLFSDDEIKNERWGDTTVSSFLLAEIMHTELLSEDSLLMFLAFTAYASEKGRRLTNPEALNCPPRLIIESGNLLALRRAAYGISAKGI